MKSEKCLLTVVINRMQSSVTKIHHSLRAVQRMEKLDRIWNSTKLSKKKGFFLGFTWLH